MLSFSDNRMIDRSSTQSGLVTRLFDENPFTGFAHIQTRPETGIKNYESLTQIKCLKCQHTR